FRKEVGVDRGPGLCHVPGRGRRRGAAFPGPLPVDQEAIPRDGGLLLAVHRESDVTMVRAHAEALDFSPCDDRFAGSAYEPVSGKLKPFPLRRAKDNRPRRRSEPDEQTIGKSIGLYFHPDPLRGFLNERNASDRRPIRIGLVNRSVCRGLCLSADEDKRATGLGVAVEPMMRRGGGRRGLAAGATRYPRPDAAAPQAHSMSDSVL